MASTVVLVVLLTALVLIVGAAVAAAVRMVLLDGYGPRRSREDGFVPTRPI